MQLDSIVIGMDFSAPAMAGATWIAEHFAPSAELTLVHVIDPPPMPRFADHLLPPPETIEAAAREFAERRLNDVAAQLAPRTPRCEVRVGKPHEEIIALVHEIGTDLIVVGPHGDRPRPSKFLGTTAERIVRASPVPVMVATQPRASRPRRLLVAVDESAMTQALLVWTRDLAETFDAQVRLLHVWSNAIYSHVASMSYATTASENEARQEIDKELHDTSVRWLENLARTGIDRDRVTATVAYGKPGDAVIATAVEMDADMIVLGRRGSGLVAPAVLGSTVGTVLHGARCPVLVIVETPEASDEQW